MRYRYLDNFRRGISVFAIFSYGITVLGTPQCPPHYEMYKKQLSILGMSCMRIFINPGNKV